MKALHTLLASLFPFGGLLAVPEQGQGAKPNIVIIVADDLGYADVLFNPQHPKEVTTPNLDALAKESVICRQGYVSGHVCSPTRAGLMTGRYQQRLGLHTGGEAGSSTAGKVGFSWRTKTEKDFAAENFATGEWPASTEWQELKVELPVKGTLLHLRLTLPKGLASIEIQSVTLTPAKGKPSVFDFSTTLPPP